VSPSRKREAVEHLEQTFEISQRRACRTVAQPRSTQRYSAQRPESETRLVRRMLDLVAQHPRYGYRRIRALLRAEGWKVNGKRVYRLWRREGLKVPRKQRKKRRLGSSQNACHRRRPDGINGVWCWDFVFDHTTSGSLLKWLSIVDEYTRECLALKVARSITAEEVIDTLAELFAIRGVPSHIRSDNGPEFIAQAIQRWLGQLGVKALYIEPGAPWENGYAESFHSKLRDEFLNAEEFASLREARGLTRAFQEAYNQARPHSGLGYQTPAAFAARCTPRRGAGTFEGSPPPLAAAIDGSKDMVRLS
jgi:putative transposase